MQRRTLSPKKLHACLVRETEYVEPKLFFVAEEVMLIDIQQRTASITIVKTPCEGHSLKGNGKYENST